MDLPRKGSVPGLAFYLVKAENITQPRLFLVGSYFCQDQPRKMIYGPSYFNKVNLHDLDRARDDNGVFITPKLEGKVSADQKLGLNDERVGERVVWGVEETIHLGPWARKKKKYRSIILMNPTANKS